MYSNLGTPSLGYEKVCCELKGVDKNCISHCIDAKTSLRNPSYLAIAMGLSSSCSQYQVMIKDCAQTVIGDIESDLEDLGSNTGKII